MSRFHSKFCQLEMMQGHAQLHSCVSLAKSRAPLCRFRGMLNLSKSQLSPREPSANVMLPSNVIQMYRMPAKLQPRDAKLPAKLCGACHA